MKNMISTILPQQPRSMCYALEEYLLLVLAVCSTAATSTKVSVSALPTPKLWEGESVRLECSVRHAEPATASAVWHRALLDPSGRRLQEEVEPGGFVQLNADDNLKQDFEPRRELEPGLALHDAVRHPYGIVRERTAELISHGETLLLSDDRFQLDVARGDDDVIVYGLKVLENQ